MRSGRRAFSMMEILVGICIFALAILPLIWLSSKQTKGTYHVGKHMMAGQLAASYMDNILSRDYEYIIDKILHNSREKEISGKVLNPSSEIKNFMNIQEMAEGLENAKANENIKSSFRNFEYKIKLTENRDEKAIRIRVEVSYLVVEGDRNSRTNRKYVELYAVKFGENNDL